MKFLPLVLRNLARNKRRTFLTVLSVAVSLFIFAALMSIPGVVRQIMGDRANSLRLVSYSKGGFFYQLPEAYRRRMESIPHVEAVVGENIFMGTYRSPTEQIPSIAVDPDQTDEMWPDFGITAAGARLLAHARTASLVGETLMRRYRWHVGDRILLRGTIYPVDIQLTIVGVLKGDAAAAVLFQRDQLKEALGRLDTVNVFWIKVDASRSIPAVIADVDRTFANSSAQTQTESEMKVSQSQMRNLKTLFDGINVLAAIVIVAIGLVAANTAAMSVRERRQELAVMRAIGYPRELIVACLVAEGVSIAIVGGLLGCGLAWGALRLVPYASAHFGTIALILRLPGRVVFESVIVALAIGFAGSVMPAITAVRRSISSSLRAA